MRILVITSELPYPTITGGRLRIYNLLKRIAQEHQVWLATHVQAGEETDGIHHLRTFCKDVLTGQLVRRSPLAHAPELLRYSFSGKPIELLFHHSAELGHKVEHLFTQEAIDIVQIEETYVAHYLEHIPQAMHDKSVLTFYDIAFEMVANIARLERNPLRRLRRQLFSQSLKRWEPRYAERFARCIAVSDVDRSRLIRYNPRLQVDVIPNGVDTRQLQPLPKARSSPSLLFIGNMGYWPGIDAALYFSHNIFPRIREVIPDAALWIVGSNPAPDVMALDGARIHVTGRVESVIPYYEQSSVCVVPLRAGTGTRLKILEAMALGRPVVSTRVGCEGLDVTHGEHLLIADDPDDFAQHVIRLLQDDALYNRVTANAREHVMARYDWDVIVKRQLAIYAELAG
jgi:sugar transferase (PEP-CTERM/EpsH1 system associated)